MHVTRQMRAACDVFQIALLDHVILGAPAKDGRAYFSFKDAGLL
ncbi:MAG: JAB domain-containing protein [Verrucomicrobiota bacterium]